MPLNAMMMCTSLTAPALSAGPRARAANSTGARPLGRRMRTRSCCTRAEAASPPPGPAGEGYAPARAQDTQSAGAGWRRAAPAPPQAAATLNQAPPAPQARAPAPAPAPQAAGEPAAAFDWAKQWYALAVVSDLDPRKPFATKLLGREIVIWRDGGGEWRALEDRCPHKLAPLSEGRIEPSDGTLQCSYHGWRFAGDGRAAAIPQARFDSPKAEATACGTRRACVKAYPTAVAWNTLFVWADAGPGAAAEAAARPLPISPRVAELKPEEVVASISQYYAREFPLSHDILVENISDQSHVPWAHHGVAHSRASPYSSHFVVSDVNRDLAPGEDGYSFRLQWSPDARSPPIDQIVKFTPPGHLEYVTEGEGGKFTALWFHITPLDDNATLVINHGVSTRPLLVPAPLLKLLALRPAWLDHLVLSEVFDGDLPNLIKGAYHSKQGDPLGHGWARAYFLPATADRSVLAMRRWYQGRGRGGFAAAEGRAPAPPPAALPRAELLDRRRQHVCRCKSCSQALQQLGAAQTALKALSAAGLLAAAAALGGGAGAAAAAAPAAAGVAAAWAASKAAAAEALFGFKDYDHSAR
ncbi:MAG: Rieske-domain-containing protein [Monoraphidium minutum]|nr:MAG: Rieske-domain-containing protein [Monoraphidium minutum]